MRKHSLESQKWFPYVAWGLVFSFAAFTMQLALNVQRDLSHLSATTERIERTLSNIDDLD